MGVHTSSNDSQRDVRGSTAQKRSILQCHMTNDCATREATQRSNSAVIAQKCPILACAVSNPQHRRRILS